MSGASIPGGPGQPGQPGEPGSDRPIGRDGSGSNAPGNPWRAVFVGLTAGGVLLAIAEVAALAFSTSASPFVAVGGAFIDLIPPWVKDAAIALFGTGDKDALRVSLLAAYLILTGLNGWLGSRRPRLAATLLGALGGFVIAVVLTRAQSTAADAIPTLIGTVVAVPLLLVLLRAVGATRATESSGSASRERVSRRAIIGAGAIGVAAIIAGFATRSISAGREYAGRIAQFVLPAPSIRAVEIPAGAQVDLSGMPPFLTPADEFYRIDTALVPPRVDPTTWQLRIFGSVDREVTMSFEDLLAEPMTEAHVTLACVSNPVGGNLVGNATWLGVPVRELLERAGVQEGADMVLSRSVDGFTASTPLEAMLDSRDALVAVGMNGAPLPREHGYPVRLVVPGLYGYVSATKWLTELKVTRFSDDLAYWSTRGWSERGPIKIASRIDVPHPGDSVSADAEGAVMIGGTAWAQQRGIERVEVRIDDEAWREAILGASVTDDTWRQWSFRWDAPTSGNHRITVRATAGDGELQTETRAAPAPNGASGWHEVDVVVA